LAGIEGEPQVIMPLERKDISFWDVLGGVVDKLDKTVENELSGPNLLYLYK
jgi:hypothetical protein